MHNYNTLVNYLIRENDNRNMISIIIVVSGTWYGYKEPNSSTHWYQAHVIIPKDYPHVKIHKIALCVGLWNSGTTSAFSRNAASHLRVPPYQEPNCTHYCL